MRPQPLQLPLLVLICASLPFETQAFMLLATSVASSWASPRPAAARGGVCGGGVVPLSSQYGPLEWDDVLRAREARAATSGKASGASAAEEDEDDENDVESTQVVLQRFWHRRNVEMDLFGKVGEIPMPPLGLPRPRLANAEAQKAKLADPEAKAAYLSKRRATMEAKGTWPKRKPAPPSKQTPGHQAANEARANTMRMKFRDPEEWERRRLRPDEVEEGGEEEEGNKDATLIETMIARQRKQQRSSDVRTTAQSVKEGEKKTKKKKKDQGDKKTEKGVRSQPPKKSKKSKKEEF